MLGCISFDSYIKPQPELRHTLYMYCCISFDSYIKPQPLFSSLHFVPVVYLLIPTSNHNLLWLLCRSSSLYIFWFLHQTTTKWYYTIEIFCCISFDSYIKPQRAALMGGSRRVVYLLIPTSNHNYKRADSKTRRLYIFWFLHQTTTFLLFRQHTLVLYIFWFLHQTTTDLYCFLRRMCCISFDSYIKPQPWCGYYRVCGVVYLLIPTSNHNTATRQ